MVDNRVLETVPQQTAGRTGELDFNVLWSYVQVWVGLRCHVAGRHERWCYRETEARSPRLRLNHAA